MLLVRILFFGSDFPLIKQGSAPVKIQKRENFSLLFVQRVDKVLNFLYNKGGKDRKLHKLCRRYAVCFRYFCDVSYPQLRELKPVDCDEWACDGNVSYPQLRELKPGPGPRNRLLRDVSYPQLRELKPAPPLSPLMICYVSYPQLRELKRCASNNSEHHVLMYLTRSCGN